MIGERISHYRVTARLGQGGMGVVYQAHDEQLGRDVALKVLPPESAADDHARARLLREARTASGLNHPNICTIHEVGESRAIIFIAMEHVLGRPLSQVIPPGGLPAETLLRYGIQIADALAHAHEHGIVHRDLKCSNVIITTPEGRAKVLDFGLAKPMEDVKLSVAVPSQALTEVGSVVGTLEYMAPELLCGEAADARSDLWALGVMLHEMASGERPFRGSSRYELSGAILHQPPAPLAERLPASLRAVILRCLAKDASHRYQRAGEVRAALETVVGFSDTSVAPSVDPAPRPRPVPRMALLAAALVAVAGLGILVAIWRAPMPPPEYRQITFRRGLVGVARFLPEDPSVIYFSAAWDDEPFELFAARPGSPEPLSVGRSDVWPLSFSPSGEMAMLREHTLCPGPYAVGTLARAPLAGGTPRDVLEGVEFAEWSPDGKGLAVARDDGEGRFRLEYPIGRLLFETSGWITHPRFSPRGDRIAFIEHPVENDYSGAIVTVDLKGHKRTLSGGWNNVFGLCWSASGREVWFTAKKTGATRSLYAVSLTGKERLVRSESSSLLLLDISRDGRVLLNRQTDRQSIVGQFAGQPEERYLSWLDWSLGTDLSRDGSRLLLQVGGGGGGGGMGSVYLRGTEGSPAVRLGEGEPLALSPDGKWALSKLPGPEPAQLVLIPTGVGEPKHLPRDSITRKAVIWFPDGQRILSAGHLPGRPARNFVQDVHGDEPRPVTPEGIAGSVTSPDGGWIAVADTALLWPLDGGEPRPLAGRQLGDVPLLWTYAGRSLYLQHGVLPASIYRLELASGEREFVRELAPVDRAGLTGIYSILLTPDGQSLVFTYKRSLAELFEVRGLK